MSDEFIVPAKIIDMNTGLMAGEIPRAEVEEHLVGGDESWDEATARLNAGYDMGEHPVEVAGDAVIKTSVWYGGTEVDSLRPPGTHVAGDLGSLLVMNTIIAGQEVPTIAAELHSYSDPNRPRVSYVALASFCPQSLDSTPTTFRTDPSRRI